MQIVLADANDTSAMNSYSMTIAITKNQADSTGVSVQASQFLNMTGSTFTFSGVTVNKTKLTDNIVASISKIDQYGYIYIVFTANMLVPKDIQSLVTLNAF